MVTGGRASAAAQASARVSRAPVAVVRIRQEGEPYRTPLDLSLEVQNNVTTHRVQLDQPSQEFRIPIKGTLSAAGLDPDDWILKEPPRWETFTARSP